MSHMHTLDVTPLSASNSQALKPRSSILCYDLQENVCAWLAMCLTLPYAKNKTKPGGVGGKMRI